MKLHQYIIGMFISTLLVWGAWILILFSVDPGASGFIGPLIFYISLFFAVVGSFTLVGFYLRVWFSRNEVIYQHATTSFRQGILLSVAFVGVLILQSFHFLTWWSILLFVLAVVILELFFVSQSKFQT
ncbi:hypothetical protein ACFL2D_00505 [Patescibacteria group bacterium]